MSEKYLQVQKALSFEEQKKFIHQISYFFPRLNGAHVADALEILHEADSDIDVVESMYKSNKNKTKRPDLIGVCTLVVLYLWWPNAANCTWSNVNELIERVHASQ